MKTGMSRRYHPRDARTAWNQGARAWQSFVRSGADYYRTMVHGPALLASCMPVAALRVLDLGCGEGHFSRELARSGALVVGVDLSESLLEYAQEREGEERLGIEYRHLDAREVGKTWEAGSFDLVTACMSLQDMEDVGTVLQGCARIILPAGRMVFSTPHPCTDTSVRVWERDEVGEKLALKIDRYFDTGPAVMNWNMPRLVYRWKTPYWRRTLEEWTLLTRAAGFVVSHLREPRASAEQVRERPELDDCSRLPYFLIFELLKS
jgi:2-polyprenyl-3-methyl-5-hydroxy-6-metoxy-1,4-benzoquinol methylase